MMNVHKPIETGADRLIRLVEDRSQITVTQASEILNVEKKTVEDWASVLENAELLIIKNNLRDKILMVPGHVDDASNSISRHVQSLFTSNESTREKMLKKQQEYVEKRIKELDKKLEEHKHLSDIKTTAECELQKLNHKKKEIEQMQSKLEKSINELQKNTKALQLKEEEIKRREEQFKKDAKELMIRTKQLITKKNLLVERENKIYEQINKIISTHEESKVKLINHLQKIKTTV